MATDDRSSACRNETTTKEEGYAKPRHRRPARPQINFNRLVIAALVMVGWMISRPTTSWSGSDVSNTQGRLPSNCGKSFASSSVPGYLSLDERMKLAMGIWGHSVHPLGPNFYRYQGEKREQEELTLDCRERFQKKNP
jgi:hypothetical protein